MATVENGVVTAKKEGTATITVTTVDGNKTATCNVTVEKETEPIIAKVTYDKTKLTDEDVTATITFNKENVTITNNDGKNTYIFKENGSFTFKYQDNEGNTGEAIAKVTWIDKTTVEVEYSTTEETEEKVIVTIKSEAKLKEIAGWNLSEDGHTLTKEYDKNTEETIYVENENGKVQEVKIKIDNIKENQEDNNNPDDDNNKPEENNPDDNNQENNKPEENNPDDNNQENNKPEENNPDNNNQDNNNKPEENNTDNNNSKDENIQDKNNIANQNTINTSNNNKNTSNENLATTLPKTGNTNFIIIGIVLVILIGAFNFVKLRKYKQIK